MYYKSESCRQHLHTSSISEAVGSISSLPSISEAVGSISSLPSISEAEGGLAAMVHLSSKLNSLVQQSGKIFSREKFFNLRGNPCLRLDCGERCKELHIHGKVLPCPSNTTAFIQTLDQLESVPSNVQILKDAEKLLKNYEALHDGIRGFISWPGYWIGKFTREDLTLLMELVVFVQATKDQFPREESLIENKCTVPPGCAKLDGRQDKFVEELWYER